MPRAGDALLDLIRDNDAAFSIGLSSEGEWLATATWGREAPDSPMAGAVAYGGPAPSPRQAVEELLTGAGHPFES